MDVTIREAEPADAERLAPLHVDVWEEAYTGLVPQRILAARRAEPPQRRVDRWRERLAWPHGSTWVAESASRGGELVGFVSAGRGRHGTDDLELMALYVRRSHYDTGIGRRLLETAIGDGPAYLWVLDGNERAVRFYERRGFAFDGAVERAEEGLHRRMTRGRPSDARRDAAGQGPA